jgi:hypothetical protein
MVGRVERDFSGFFDAVIDVHFGDTRGKAEIPREQSVRSRGEADKEEDLRREPLTVIVWRRLGLNEFECAQSE